MLSVAFTACKQTTKNYLGSPPVVDQQQYETHTIVFS